jgi:hypothetical protein
LDLSDECGLHASSSLDEYICVYFDG